MDIHCAHDKITSILELRAHPKNRNKHPKEQIERLAKILEYQGWRSPIKVSNRSGFITSGHGRLEAAKLNGWEEAPVNFQDYDSEEQEYADVQSDNAIAAWAELDLSGINQDVIDLGPDFDIDLLGIEDFVLEPADKLNPQCDEDEIPEHVEPKTKLGDIYKLGAHRLMCGDSTSIDAVYGLMNGSRSDITFTSPPYNAGKNIRGNFYENDTDDKSEDDYVDFLHAFTANALMISDFVFVNIQLLESNKRSIVKYQYNNLELLKDILIWNKTQYPPHINKGTFGTKWEYVFCFAQSGKSRGFPCSWQGKFPNVIETENNSGNEFAKKHKAGFPVAFPKWLIEKMDFAKSVYDPFMGTGTTFIACEALGIKGFGMELDPHYCDVIVARWEKYTGQKAELINGPA